MLREKVTLTGGGGKYGGVALEGREEFLGARTLQFRLQALFRWTFATAENAGSFVERTFCWLTMGVGRGCDG